MTLPPLEKMTLSGPGLCPFSFEESIDIIANAEEGPVQILQYVVRAWHAHCDRSGYPVSWSAQLQLVFGGESRES